MKTVVVMCPACGKVAYPKEIDSVNKTCTYCNTVCILTDGNGGGMILGEGGLVTIPSEEEKLRRRYLFPNPQFNEDLYTARMTEEEMQREIDKAEFDKRIYERDHPSCPRCRSTAITAGQRGFNIITGFFGSNQTVNRCASCGHQWKP